MTKNAKDKAWRLKSEKWAEQTIKEMIDLEHVFDAEAPYECLGAQLRDYLAFAYRCGQIDGTLNFEQKQSLRRTMFRK